MARLPSAYQEVEWIEGNGTQYIKTGFTTTLTMKIEVDATCVNSSCVIGTMPINGSTNSNFTIGKYNSTVAYLCWNGQEIDGENWSGRSTMTGYQDDTKVYRIYNGTTTSANIVNSIISTPSELWMFRRNSPGGGDGGGAKIYSCKIYDNNILVREFVPCYRISDNEIGMYDTVNDVFYTNQGTGTFTKGNDVYTFPDFRAVKGFQIKIRLPEEYQEVEYIESSGTQWIDTGVSLFDYDQNLDIEIDCSFSSSSGMNGVSASGSSAGLYWFSFPEKDGYSGYIQCTGGSWSSYSNYSGDRSVIKLNSKTGANSIGARSDTATTSKFSDVASRENTDGNLYLFAGNNWISYMSPSYPQPSRFANEKIYYCIMKNATTGDAIRDFVPCYRKSDSVIGLYDLVNNTFYTNSGTGTFTKGDDVYPVVNSVEVIKISIPSGEVTHNLPTEYQEVEYIESDGTQWVDSGTASQVGHKHTFEGTISITSNNGDRETVWGNDYADLQQNILLQYAVLGEKATWTYYHSLIDYSILLKKNGITVSSGSYSSYRGNATIAIFSSYFGSSSIRKAHIKLFELKIYYDNETTPIRHFIPCYRKSDGVIGLYDIINDAFHTKQSGNDFTKGDDIIGEIVLWEKPEQ